MLRAGWLGRRLDEATRETSRWPEWMRPGVTVSAHDQTEPADWISGGRCPEKPGWYWCWDGYPNHEPVIVKISQDELGNWSWAIGAWFGEFTSMVRRYPWRWSNPVPPPGR